MTHNPYTPPSAEVSDRLQRDASPALWNPNAAANWSLLFSPAFGAFVHMKNRQALDEPDKAANAKVWAIASLVAVIGLACFSMLLNLLALQGLARMADIVLLLSWYFVSARGQAQYIDTRYGKSYSRKGWGKPLLFAIAVFIAYIAAFMLCGFIAAMLSAHH